MILGADGRPARTDPVEDEMRIAIGGLRSGIALRMYQDRPHLVDERGNVVWEERPEGGSFAGLAAWLPVRP